MLPVLGQANDVEVLPWKVLMNEENSHASETLQRFRLVLKLSEQQLKVEALRSLMLAVRLMPTCKGKEDPFLSFNC